jgi:hypothetical protein
MNCSFIGFEDMGLLCLESHFAARIFKIKVDETMNPLNIDFAEGRRSQAEGDCGLEFS